MMCRLLGVKHNGFYRYVKAQKPPRPDDDIRQASIEWMHKIARTSDYSYGSCRMKKALNYLGYP